MEMYLSKVLGTQHHHFISLYVKYVNMSRFSPIMENLKISGKSNIFIPMSGNVWENNLIFSECTFFSL